MDTPKPTRIFFAPVKPWTGTPVRVRVHPSEEPLTVEQIQVRRELMKLQLAQKQADGIELKFLGHYGVVTPRART